MTKKDEILEIIAQMSKDEFNALAEDIDIIKFFGDIDLNKAFEDFVYNDSSRAKCPRCGGSSVKKNGFYASGLQKYLCKDCNRCFNVKTGTVFAGSNLTTKQWISVVKSIIFNHTCREAAYNAGISPNSAHTNMMKISKLLAVVCEEDIVSGIVHVDEKYVRESFKGNHSKSEFKLPREARKHGKSMFLKEKPGLSQNQVAVLTAVDFDGNIILKPVCTGSVKNSVLKEKFLPHTYKVSIISDAHRSWTCFCKENMIEHVSIKGGIDSETKQTINVVNTLHSIFDGYLERHKGVSTKYLGCYSNRFKFLRKIKDDSINVQIKAILEKAFTTELNLNASDLVTQPATF